MSLRLPIGYDNFGRILEEKLDLVDKTLLIQAILDDGPQVIVITRPRRFGKTLNLSMLQHFFAAQAYMCETKGLFDGFKIAALGETYMRHQGQYPVIFITLKDIKDHHYASAYKAVTNLLQRVYLEYDYLLLSPALSDTEKQKFSLILTQTAEEDHIRSALLDLSSFLSKHHRQKVWLFIDEYDTPIQSAYLHGYYDEMISLMRGMFSSALKTNPYLKKAVITGILRITKESLFSGLNNAMVYTLLDDQYSEYFGFTESEVTDLFHRAGLDRDADKIRGWYNGYQCGQTVIYNPWSIVNCIYQKGSLRPYWVNTSGNDLIKQLLAEGDVTLKDQLEQLIAHQPITALISPNTVFGDLAHDQNALWSLLLFSGYLKVIECTRVKNHLSCLLVPPNYEVKILYEDIIQSWFLEPLGQGIYQGLLNSLVRGDIEEFRMRLEDCLALSFSIFDVTGQHPEKFYHGFVLGLMVSLSETHDVQSNKESGYGRYDVMLIPKDKTQLGIVMEFKTLRDKTADLTQCAESALQQIIDRSYADILRAQGINHIVQLGLAFYGKTVAMVGQ